MNNKKVKDEFLPFISHKLLIPATIIKWNSELLKKELNETDRNINLTRSIQMINDIIKSNDKQIDFIKHVLDQLQKINNLAELKESILKKYKK